MTGPKPIVERLRELASVGCDRNSMAYINANHAVIFDQAADHITSLEADNALLKAELEMARTMRFLP